MEHTAMRHGYGALVAAAGLGLALVASPAVAFAQDPVEGISNDQTAGPAQPEALADASEPSRRAEGATVAQDGMSGIPGAAEGAQAFKATSQAGEGAAIGTDDSGLSGSVADLTGSGASSGESVVEKSGFADGAEVLTPATPQDQAKAEDTSEKDGEATSGVTAGGTYTVCFETGDGSSLLSQAVEGGRVTLAPDDPTREGYDFAGWYVDDQFTTRYDFSSAVQSDLTLFARWDPKNGWYDKDGAKADALTATQWYDNGVLARFKEFYDPSTDGWYWADDDGSIATDKDVYVRSNGGKWVRYDAARKMVKGEDFRYGGWYLFDGITGAMAKAMNYVGSNGGKWVYYDVSTGVMAHGEKYLDYDEEHTGWYYFDDFTGAATHGWKRVNDSRWVYYGELDGKMRSGGTVLTYVGWMLDIASDDTHGYDQRYRWGEYGDYDCSSLVITALRHAGLNTYEATYTGNMRSQLRRGGRFVWMTDFSQLTNGDILLNDGHHTAVYLGCGQLVHASQNEFGGASGGAPGDQTGTEVFVRSYYDYPWNGFLRYVGA